MKFYFQLLSSLVLLLTSVVVQAYEFDPAGNLACFYDQPNYQGAEYCYGVGDVASLDSPIKNIFESVRIPQNIEVFGFNYSNFTGTMEIYSADTAAIVNLNANLESLKIYDLSVRQFDPSGLYTCFYTQPNFEGAEFCYGVGDHAEFDPILKNLFQSVRVPQNIEVFGFNYRNFTGTMEIYSADTAVLGSLNQNLESLKIYDLSVRQFNPSGSNTCFYTQHDFEGAEFCYGVGEHAELDPILKNLFQSVRVPQNIEVFGFNYRNFTGTMEIYSADTASIVNLKANLESLKVYDLSVRQFDPSGSNTCFYTQPNFEGAEFCYGIGDYAQLDPMLKNLFQSVRVPQNVEVFGFNYSYFNGTKEIYSADAEVLGRLNQTLESFKIYNLSVRQFDHSGTNTCFYTQPNFEGAEFCYGVGEYEQIDPILRNLFQSVRVPLNTEVFGFNYSNFNGAIELYSQDTAAISSLNVDLESFKIYDLSVRMFDPVGSNICFYTQPNFEGAEFCYEVGEHAELDPILKSLFQSVRVPQNIEVFGFNYSNFTGTMEIYSADAAVLGSLNQTLESLKIYDLSIRQFDPSGSNTCFYTQPNFEGAEFCYEAGEHAEFDPILKNLFQSVRVPQNIEVFGFNYRNFTGTMEIYSADTAEIVNLNTNLESLKIYDLSVRQFDPSGSYTCFYTQPNFEGAEFCYGVGEHAELDPILKNLFQSVRVPQNTEVFGFNYRNFTGTMEIYSADTTAIVNLNANLESLKIYDLSVRQFNPSGSNTCFYTQPNFEGAEFCYGVGEHAQINPIVRNLFQSVRVPLNTEVFGFNYSDFNGARELYSQDAAVIVSLNIDLESFKIYDLSVRQFDAAGSNSCFYTQLNYQGAEFCYAIGDYVQLDKTLNNLFQSLKLPQNFQVTGYNYSNFTGTAITYTSEAATLGSLGKSLTSFQISLKNTELDSDDDGISDSYELQLGTDPADPASVPADFDSDGIPDQLDDDLDGDGVTNSADLYPDDPTESADLDGDGIGDNSDTDMDGDGINNDYETQLGTNPADPISVPADLDSDGMPDALDDDIDGDGVNNLIDSFPNDPAESSDLDGDGIGDNSDSDIDGDGFSNDEEIAGGSNPNDPNNIPGANLRVLFSLITPPLSDSQFIDLTGAVYGDIIDRVYLTSDHYPDTTFAANIVNNNWSARVPLKVGDNLIRAHVEGNNNETAEVSKIFRRKEPPPLISMLFDTPLNNSLVNTDSIVVTGRIISETIVTLPVVNVNTIAAEVSQGASPTEFVFSAAVSLQQGANKITASSVVAGESLQEDLIINYQPADTQILPPVVHISSPHPGTTLMTDSFVLTMQATSDVGLSAVTINGQPEVISASGQIKKTLNFAGQSQLDVIIVVTDNKNQQSTLNASYNLDALAPVIQVDSMQPYPAENIVTDNPYNLSGTVTDATLLQLTLNDKVLTLEPTAIPHQYRFNTNLMLSAGVLSSIHLTAIDAAGNQSPPREYLLKANSDIQVSWITPADKSVILLQAPGQTLDISARLSNISGIGDVQLDITGQAGTSSVTMALNTDIASARITLPDSAGEYTLALKVLDINSQLLTASTRSITLKSAQALPLEIVKLTPQDGATDAEPNDFVAVFFNKAIDLNLLDIQLHETVHGFDYVNVDPPGLDSMNAKGYQLQNVNRDYEPVPGVFSLLPNNTTAVFYPQQEMAYDSDLYVTINYDGQEMARSHFKVRPRPTFIEGLVMDNLGQAVAGVEVSLSDLNRVTKTDSEGSYSFGFGDSAEQNISGGLHKLSINAGLKDNRFGNINTQINLQQGAKNVIPSFTLPLLNREIPFAYINSHATQVFNGGELSIDTQQASLAFPDGAQEGPVHVQFLPGSSHLPPVFKPEYIPQWSYSVQPSGIKVEGNISLDFALPKYRQSYEYAPQEGELVLLLGSNSNSSQLIPVGVGEAIAGNRVHSVGQTHFNMLDTIAYSMVMPEQRLDLRAYQQGEIDLQQLTLRLQTFTYNPPKDEAEAISRAKALQELGIK